MAQKTVTLAEGLVYLKRLKSEINRAKELTKPVSATTKEQAQEELKTLEERFVKFIGLKGALIRAKLTLEKASYPIRDKIFEISEHKDTVTQLQAMTCGNQAIVEEDHTDRYYRGDSGGKTKIIYKVSPMTSKGRDDMIRAIERQIDKIQSEINAFNHKTMVEIEETI